MGPMGLMGRIGHIGGKGTGAQAGAYPTNLLPFTFLLLPSQLFLWLNKFKRRSG